MAEIITCPACWSETITVNASSSECISLSSSSKQLCQDSKGTRVSVLPLIWSWVRNLAWNESRNSINRRQKAKSGRQREASEGTLSHHCVCRCDEAAGCQRSGKLIHALKDEECNGSGRRMLAGTVRLIPLLLRCRVYVWKHIYLISHMLHVRAAVSLLHTSDPGDQGQRWTGQHWRTPERLKTAAKSTITQNKIQFSLEGADTLRESMHRSRKGLKVNIISRSTHIFLS